MRDGFLGNYRTETNPIAVEQGECRNTVELGGNHCGALHKRLTLQPGEEARLIFMLGVGPRSEGQGDPREVLATPANVDRAFAILRSYWQRQAGRLPMRDAACRAWTP